MAGIPIISEETIKILSNKKSYEFEPQGSLIVGDIKFQKWREDFWDRIKELKGKVLIVLGITEFHEFIVLIQQIGRDPLVFNIKEDETELFLPIKNMEGMLIPINMPKQSETYYFGCATMNGNHNSEIIDLIDLYSKGKLTHDLFYNKVTKKYI